MKVSLVALPLLVVGTFLIGAVPAGAGDKVQVAGVYQLYVREAPSLDATPIGVLAAGDVVEVVGQVGRWARIAFKDGKTGYVSRKYLVPAEPTEQRVEGAEETDGGPRTDAAAARSSAAKPADAGKPTSGEPAPLSQSARAARASPARRPTRRAPACTAADLEELRRGLREITVGQERLATLVDSRLAVRPAGGWEPPLAAGRGLILVGVGCIVGWVASRSYARRQRNRIRM
jgi:hypothetical protein